MFPGPGAQVYRNEAGEPIGWDYPGDHDGVDFCEWCGYYHVPGACTDDEGGRVLWRLCALVALLVALLAAPAAAHDHTSRGHHGGVHVEICPPYCGGHQ